MKKYVLLTLCLFCTLSAQATPDRYRMIIDTLLGFHGSRMVILQTVYDNESSHYEHTIERYLLEKEMAWGETTIYRMSKLEGLDDWRTLGEAWFGEDMAIAFPEMPLGPERFMLRDSAFIKDGYGNDCDLRSFIPRELKDCKITRVVDFYFDPEPMNLILVLDLENSKGTEYYRKAVQIPVEIWEVKAKFDQGRVALADRSPSLSRH